MTASWSFAQQRRRTLVEVPAQGGRALVLEAREQALVMLRHALQRPLRPELDHEQPHLPREPLVGAQDARAARSPDELAVDRVMRLDDGAPGRLRLLADGGHESHRVVDRLRQPATTALEREPGGLDLQRGAQLEQRPAVGRGEPGDGRAAVRLDRDQALAGQLAQRRAQRVAGDAVGLGELELAQPLAGGQLAVEDPGPQRGGDGVDRRDALERQPRAHAGTVASRGARRRAGRASETRPASTSAAPIAATAPGRSPSTTTPSSVAVSGSASVSVAVSPGVRLRSPRANSTYASAVGIAPRNSAMARPSPVPSHAASPVISTGASSSAPSENDAAITRSGAWPRRSSRFARTVYVA